MLIKSLKIIKSYTNGGIISVVMDIISNFLSIAQKHKNIIGKKLSIIGQGLTDNTL